MPSQDDSDFKGAACLTLWTSPPTPFTRRRHLVNAISCRDIVRRSSEEVAPEPQRCRWDAATGGHLISAPLMRTAVVSPLPLMLALRCTAVLQVGAARAALRHAGPGATASTLWIDFTIAHFGDVEASFLRRCCGDLRDDCAASAYRRSLYGRAA